MDLQLLREVIPRRSVSGIASLTVNIRKDPPLLLVTIDLHSFPHFSSDQFEAIALLLFAEGIRFVG